MLYPPFGFVQTATGSTEQTQRTEGESDDLASPGALLQHQQTDGASELELRRKLEGQVRKGTPSQSPRSHLWELWQLCTADGLRQRAMEVPRPSPTPKKRSEMSLIFHRTETPATSAVEHTQYLILQDFKSAAPLRLFLHAYFLDKHLTRKKKKNTYRFSWIWNPRSLSIG